MLNIGQIRAKQFWALDPNYEELMEKLKTETVDKFQTLFCLSREYFVYSSYAPFLVLAHKENCMSFLICEMDHKSPISGLFSFRLNWEIHTDARKHIKHLILPTTKFCWLKLAQLIVEYKSRCAKTNLLTDNILHHMNA